ncbi:S8/S53 family peptidase [Runella limosa]|uniref:S8/S53 family peptidase n=1 Tax=Runella limosa TaxID=370978 RepID=UPI0003FD119F|nr:S8/S53 family peptidase [Runella limosa]
MAAPIKIQFVDRREYNPQDPIQEIDLADIRITAPAEISVCFPSPQGHKQNNFNGFLSPVDITKDGQSAVKNQKILILKTSDYNTLKEKSTISKCNVKDGKKCIDIIQISISFKQPKGCLGFLFEQPRYTAEVVRAGECPNGKDADGDETTIVLIEWEDNDQIPPFAEIDSIRGINSLSQITYQFDQLTNLIISPDPAGDPGDPIKSATEYSPSQITRIYPSQLQVVTQTNEYKNGITSDTNCIAVLDTGLKFSTQGASYQDKSGNFIDFKVANPFLTCGLESDSLGYNAVTDYLKVYKAAILDYDPNNIAFGFYSEVFKKIQNMELTREDIINTPYDDNLVDEIDEAGCCKPQVGRHGTIISAIINQKNNWPVLPVKVFNAAGFGTFFDLLCGLNYVIGQKKAGLNIQALNASFVGSFLEGSQELNFLEEKFQEIASLGIWIASAAGNEDVNLDSNKKYPACFSIDKMITVGTATIPYLVNRNNSPTNYEQNLAPSIRQAILNLPALTLLASPQNLSIIRDTNWLSTNNISPQVVHLAVGNSDIETDELPSPFYSGSETFTGTSIATAYTSAMMTVHLPYNGNRNSLIDLLSSGRQSDTLRSTVNNGRLMLVNTEH